MSWRDWLRRGKETAVAPMSPRVLVVIHNPVVRSENGRKLRDLLHGHDPDELLPQFILDLHHASHGLVNYQIVDRVEVDGFPVKEDGFVYDAETYLYRWRSRTGFHRPARMDYERFLQEFGIISRINLGQIDEVWLLGFPHAGYDAWMMAGPGAFASNGPPLAADGRCQRRFILMGFSYQQGLAEMLTRYGRRVELIMAHVYRHKRGAANLWQRFTRIDKTHPGQAECGTLRLAPNSEQDGDWANPRPVHSRCHTWLNFPDLSGPPQLVDCREWGEGDARYHHLWWLGRLPHVAGSTGGIAHNWWEYVVDPNRVR